MCVSSSEECPQTFFFRLEIDTSLFEFFIKNIISVSFCVSLSFFLPIFKTLEFTSSWYSSILILDCVIKFFLRRIMLIFSIRLKTLIGNLDKIILLSPWTSLILVSEITTKFFLSLIILLSSSSSNEFWSSKFNKSFINLKQFLYENIFLEYSTLELQLMAFLELWQ